LDKERSEEKIEVSESELLEWAHASRGTRQTVAELKRDVDAKIADIDRQIADVKTALLTVTESPQKDIHQLLLSQMYETRERVDSDYGILTSVLVMGDVFLQLVRAKADSKEARSVARHETQRQIKTLEQRITDNARKKWFRQNYPERRDK
jgi:hypothetical protein